MHYIIHAGVAHDKNPPGRGSGRYPFGSKNNVVSKIKQKHEKQKMIKNAIERIVTDRKKIKDYYGDYEWVSGRVFQDEGEYQLDDTAEQRIKPDGKAYTTVYRYLDDIVERFDINKPIEKYSDKEFAATVAILAGYGLMDPRRSGYWVY